MNDESSSQEEKSPDNDSTNDATVRMSNTSSNENLQEESLKLKNDITLIRQELETFTSTMRLKSSIIQSDINLAMDYMNDVTDENKEESDDDDDDGFYWKISTESEFEKEDEDVDEVISISKKEYNELQLTIKEKDRIIGEYKSYTSKMKKENSVLKLLKSNDEKELESKKKEIDDLYLRISDLEHEINALSSSSSTVSCDASTTSSLATTSTSKKKETISNKETKELMEIYNKNTKKREPIRVLLRLRPSNKIESSLPPCSKFQIEFKNNNSYHKYTPNNTTTSTSNDFLVIDSSTNSSIGGSTMEYEFSYDKIFDCDVKNHDIYSSVAYYSDELLRGVNCCIMGIGTIGSGKKFTLLGRESCELLKELQRDGFGDDGEFSLGNNSLLNDHIAYKSSSSSRIKCMSRNYTAIATDETINDATSQDTSTNTSNENITKPNDNEDDDDEGILPKLIHSIFTKIKNNFSPNTEFTIKLSYLGIHLEKMFDLLDPSSSNNKTFFVSHDAIQGKTIIEGGITSAYCFNKEDVKNILVRGHICQSILSKRMGIDLYSWHTILLIDVHRIDLERNVQFFSQFSLVELAAYYNGNSTMMVDKLMSNSFVSLNNIVKGLADYNDSRSKRVPLLPYHESKLTSLFQDILGGNCRTTILVTSSKTPPTSSIANTLKVLRLGQRICDKKNTIFNTPRVNIELTIKQYRHWLISNELKLGELISFVQQLAKELSINREKYADRRTTSSTSTTTTLWDSIWSIVDKEERYENPCRKAFVNGTINELLSKSKVGESNKALKWKSLSTIFYNRVPSEEFLSLTKKQKRTESLLYTSLSNVQILQKQLYNALKQNETLYNTTTIQNLQSKIQKQAISNIEMEYKLILSQFRENECKIFLKHIRGLNQSYVDDLISFGIYHNHIGGANALSSSQTTTTSAPTSSMVSCGTIPERGSIGTSAANTIVNDNDNLGVGVVNNTDAIDNTITPLEIISSTYIAESSPTLKELIDFDSFLLEAGLLDDHDYHSKNKKSVNVGGTNNKLSTFKNNDSGGDEDESWNVFEEHLKLLQEFVEKSYVGTKDMIVKQGGSTRGDIEYSNVVTNEESNQIDTVNNDSIALPKDANKTTLLSFSPWLAYVKHLSNEAQGNNEDSLHSSTMMNKRHSISTTTSTTSNTSMSKPLVSQREKQLEKDIRLIAKKCLELKMYLDEVMILSRYGNLKTNRLAQETLATKQQSYKYMIDAKISAWKLQELQIMNKALQKHTNDSKQYINILENHIQTLQNSLRDNVISSQDVQSSLSNKILSLETLLNALLGSSTFAKLQQSVEQNDLNDIDLRLQSCALINQPIHGYKVMIDDQQDILQQCQFDGNAGGSNSFGKSILDGIGHLYMSTPPDYLVNSSK